MSGKLFEGNDRFCRVIAPPEHLLMAAEGLCRWPQKRITYSELLTLNGMARADVAAVYDLAWKQWADVCDIQPVRLTSLSLPGVANVAATQGPIDGPWGTLAYSYLPCGASEGTQLTQQYDDGETWTYAFLLACACHEIGHALGLNHLGTGNLMAPILDPNITEPQYGDIAEIQARYGPPGVVPTPVPIPVPTPTPAPTPIPSNLALDGLWRSYTLSPGGTEERYPFHVPGRWWSNRRPFTVAVRGDFVPVVSLYGHLGKLLDRQHQQVTMKLYEGDYSVGVRAEYGQGVRGGVFQMAAKLG